MAHFVELNSDNIVIRTIVIDDSELHKIQLVNGTLSVVQDEEKGIEFCQRLLGGGVWKLTSDDGFRKNYGVIGSTYDESLDVFITPKPDPTYILDAECKWQPPKED